MLLDLLSRFRQREKNNGQGTATRQSGSAQAEGGEAVSGPGGLTYSREGASVAASAPKRKG
jgi:hypothetical protein